jgi:uncharacterized membrane protein
MRFEKEQKYKTTDMTKAKVLYVGAINVVFGNSNLLINRMILQIRFRKNI